MRLRKGREENPIVAGQTLDTVGGGIAVIS